MSRPKPFRDPALDGLKPPASHVFPVWYCGEVRCERCHHTVTEIDARCLPCVTDTHLAQAARLGQVWAAIRRQR